MLDAQQTPSLQSTFQRDTKTPKKIEQVEKFQVYLRIRPLLQGEVQKTFLEVDNVQALAKLVRAETSREYKFTKVYQDIDNKKLFDEIVRPSLAKVFLGESLVVFAYGITGSGKTHTICGSSTENGILQETFRELLEMKQHEAMKSPQRDPLKSPQSERGTDIKIAVSFLEVYNELCYDLYSSQQQPNFKSTTPRKNQQVSTCKQVALHTTDTDTLVPQAQVKVLSTEEDCQRFCEEAMAQRRSQGTKLNSSSSRSHCVCFIYIIVNGKIISRLAIVDLAGSERISVTEQDNAQINGSLLVLGRCLAAMAKGEAIIPFRDSVLTTLMKPFLSGALHSSRVMLVNISPSGSSVEENANVLMYGALAVKIKIVSKVNTRQGPNAQVPGMMMQTDKSGTSKMVMGNTNDQHQPRTPGTTLLTSKSKVGGMNANDTQRLTTSSNSSQQSNATINTVSGTSNASTIATLAKELRTAQEKMAAMEEDVAGQVEYTNTYYDAYLQAHMENKEMHAKIEELSRFIIQREEEIKEEMEETQKVFAAEIEEQVRLTKEFYQHPDYTTSILQLYNTSNQGMIQNQGQVQVQGQPFFTLQSLATFGSSTSTMFPNTLSSCPFTNYSTISQLIPNTNQISLHSQQTQHSQTLQNPIIQPPQSPEAFPQSTQSILSSSLLVDEKFLVESATLDAQDHLNKKQNKQQAKQNYFNNGSNNKNEQSLMEKDVDDSNRIGSNINMNNQVGKNIDNILISKNKKDIQSSKPGLPPLPPQSSSQTLKKKGITNTNNTDEQQMDTMSTIRSLPGSLKGTLKKKQGQNRGNGNDTNEMNKDPQSESGDEQSNRMVTRSRSTAAVMAMLAANGNPSQKMDNNNNKGISQSRSKSRSNSRSKSSLRSKDDISLRSSSSVSLNSSSSSLSITGSKNNSNDINNTTTSIDSSLHSSFSTIQSSNSRKRRKMGQKKHVQNKVVVVDSSSESSDNEKEDKSSDSSRDNDYDSDSKSNSDKENQQESDNDNLSTQKRKRKRADRKRESKGSRRGKEKGNIKENSQSKRKRSRIQ